MYTHLSMKLIRVIALGLFASSLMALGQTNTRAIDLSTLEIINRIAVPRHGLGSLPETAMFSPNGKGLVTRDGTGILIWWEVSTGEQLQRWKLSDSFQLRGFIDRKTILLLENQKQFKLFDLETGNMRSDPRNGLDRQEVANLTKLYSPDKTIYLTRQDDYPVLSDAKTNKLIRRFGHVVTDFDIAPNGDVITGSQAGTMRTWNVKTGKEISRFTGIDQPIQGMVISPNGQFMATVSGENTVQMWNSSGREQFKIKVNTLPTERNYIYRVHLAFSADNQILAISNGEKPLKQHDLLQLHQTRDGRQVQLPAVNGNSKLFFANRSDVLLQEEVLGEAYKNCTQKRRLSMISLTTGNVIWVGSWRNSDYQDWLFSTDGSIFARHLENYNPDYVCSDDERLGRGTAIGVSSIDSQTGEGQGWFRISSYVPQSYPSLLAITPDNRMLLTETYNAYEGEIHSGIGLNNLQTGEILPLPPRLAFGYKIGIGTGGVGHIPRFKFSPDGKYLMVWADNRIDVWGTRDNSAIFKGK